MSSTIVNPGEFLPEITQKDLEEVIVIQKLIRENLSENAFKWWMARMIELHREGSRADILHLRQYIKDIKRLPLMRGMETKPMTSNKAFIASHKIKDLDNLLIRILAMLTDNQNCKVLECFEGVSESEFLGDKKEGRFGEIVESIIHSRSFSGMIVFTQAQHILKQPFIYRIVNPDERCNFVDKYLGFPIDLSKFTVLFLMEESEITRIPGDLRGYLHECDWNFISAMKGIKISHDTEGSNQSAFGTPKVNDTSENMFQEN